MLGHDARDAAGKERDAVGTCRWRQSHNRGIRHEAGAGTARRTGAAHRSRVRRNLTVMITGAIVVSTVVLRMPMDHSGAATMMLIARDRQITRQSA